MTPHEKRTLLVCAVVIACVAAGVICCRSVGAEHQGQTLMRLAKAKRGPLLVAPAGIMPPTNAPMLRAVPHAPPTNLVSVTLAWSNDISNYPSWGWVGGSTITNSDGKVIWSTNGGHWQATYLDLNAASNSMVTGLYTVDLRSTNKVLRESHPFALSNRVTLRMLTNEYLRAFHGPKSK